MGTEAALPSDSLTASGAVFDLSHRSKLRIGGSDRQRYLNGQISNDLRKATATSAIQACVLTAKGKIDAEVFLAADGESFLLDSDPGVGETLSARLERYIIADDVSVEDVTDVFALFHVVGAGVPPVSANELRRASARLGETGTDIWIARAEHSAVWQTLSQMFPIFDEAATEILRVERGIPRWGHELTAEIIPTEANLEERAIDYAKGCYIGQEVISRIKMSGQTNKRLCGLRVENSTALPVGFRLVAPDDQKDVGWITSSVVSPRFGTIALGFLKRGYQEAGSNFHAVPGASAQSGAPVPVTVVRLPFV